MLPRVALILVIVFSFLSIEWHADHDGDTGSATDQTCCIQCCVSHNLAPLSAKGNSLNVPRLVDRLIEFSDTFQPELIRSSIDRPPIA